MAEQGGRSDASPVLQRAAELGAIDRAADAARQGEGRCIVVEGPAGIGKTTVLQSARHSLQSADWRVLSARGLALEIDYSYGVARQLLDRIGTDTTDPDDVFDGAAALAQRVFDGAGPPPIDTDVAYATMHGLYWLVANLARSGSLAIIVDDAHWADPASLRWLAHLCARLDGLSVLVLLAIRSGPARRSDTELAELRMIAGAAASIRPAPLDQAAVATLARLRLGAAASTSLCAACFDRTGGNPFLLRSLLDAIVVADDGLQSRADAILELGPPAVADAIVHRVGQMTQGSEALVRALAVIGRPATVREATALTGQQPATVARLADELRAADLLAPDATLEFVHPIVRTAIYESIPVGDRALGHAATAGMLLDDHADPEQVALHLLRSDPASDPNVVAVLREAARAAVGRGVPDAAAACLRRALNEPPDRAGLAHVMLELGAAMALVLDPAAAGVIRQAIERMPTGSAPIGTVLSLVGFLGSWAHHDAAAGICLTALESSTAARERGLLEAELVANEQINPSTVRDAGSRLRRWCDGPALTVQQRIVSAMSDTCRGLGVRQVLDRLTPVLDEHPELLMSDSLIASHVPIMLAWNGELLTALHICEAAQDAARTRGSRNMAAHADSVHALITFRLGRLKSAVADGQVAIQYDRMRAPALAIAWAASFLIDALLEQGELDDAREIRAMALAHEPPSGYMHTLMLTQSCGRLALADGRPEDAIKLLRGAGRGWERLAVTHPGIADWRLAAVTAHLTLGERTRAVALAREQLRLARATGEPSALSAALRAVAATPTTDDDPQRLLSEAVAVLETSTARLSQAHALAELGMSHRRRGHPTQAREPLARALDLAHRSGAEPVVQVVHHELTATGARPRRPWMTGPDALTDAERRVASLAADGMSNRMIAQHLFITQSTVETHLRHTFQKLGIGSRSALAQQLQAPQERASP